MDPAIETLLQRNGVPTDTQTSQLRHLIQAGEAEIAQLEQTSQTLSLLLAELRFQALRKSESLNPLRGALSLFRRFPAELLGEIFELSVNAEGIQRWDPTSIADPKRSPMRLGHVCSQWRMIAHNLPRLWNMPFFRSTTVAGPDKASVIQSLMDRSRSLPLSLSVLTPHFFWEPHRFEDGNLRFFEILWTSHLRFKSLTLGLTVDHVSRLPSLFAPHQLPILEFLTVSIEGANRDPVNIGGILNSLQHSPALHSFDLYFDESTSTTPIAASTFPWSQLTHFRINMGITVAEVRDILARCPQLESIRVSLGSFPGETQSSWRPNILRHVREVCFAVPNVDASSEAFFDAFSFPNLERLSIDVGVLSPNAFLAFYTRSSFRLRYLHLERLDDLLVDQLFPFLQTQPTLDTLRLVNCRLCDEPELFRLFTRQPQPSRRALNLPVLRTLEIQLSFDWEGTVVADMAEFLYEQRGEQSPFPSLEHVYLTTHSCEPEALYSDVVEERLAAVAATGFVLREVSADPGDITKYSKWDGPRWT
ncbi:hypothetical protein C8R45DRAFT_1207823 [Mycena sanguinolenta]|nr:hypothetical protein C8R45DRAFT_1207823 [Mycena sanguinolenta]